MKQMCCDAEVRVYPSRDNSSANPVTYGSSGPRTNEFRTFTTTLSSFPDVRGQASNTSPDYADLINAEPLHCSGSRLNVGIIRRSA
jgi:hypothetical protein